MECNNMRECSLLSDIVHRAEYIAYASCVRAPSRPPSLLDGRPIWAHHSPSAHLLLESDSRNKNESRTKRDTNVTAL